MGFIIIFFFKLEQIGSYKKKEIVLMNELNIEEKNINWKKKIERKIISLWKTVDRIEWVFKIPSL